MLRLLPPRASVRSAAGAKSVETRIGVPLRVLAGASYCDVSVRLDWGVPWYNIYVLWLAIDAVNRADEIGPIFLPQAPAECRKNADGFQVRDFFWLP